MKKQKTEKHVVARFSDQQLASVRGGLAWDRSDLEHEWPIYQPSNPYPGPSDDKGTKSSLSGGK